MKAHTTKYKKLSLKIRYVTLEHEEVTEQYEEYRQLFHERLVYLSKQHKTPVFKEKTKKVEKKSNTVVNTKTDKKQPKIFKDLYRDIAKMSHPDVTGDDKDKSRLMRQATRAKNSGDLIALLDICDDLDIPPPDITDEHLEILEKNVASIENKMRSVYKMDAWVWGESTPEVRHKYEHMIFHPLTGSK